MRRIRLGKDITVRRELTLSTGTIVTSDLEVTITDVLGNDYPVDWVVDDGNVIVSTIRGYKLLKAKAPHGIYSMTWWYRKGKAGATVLDCDGVFCLVSSTEQEGGDDDGEVETDVIDLSGGTMIIGAMTADDELSETSENPIQNQAVTKALKKKANESDVVKDVKYFGNPTQIVVVLQTEDGREIARKPLPAATKALAGIMTAEDKKALDNLKENGASIVVDSVLSTSSTNPVQNRIVAAKVRDYDFILDANNINAKGIINYNFIRALKKYIHDCINGTEEEFDPLWKHDLDELSGKINGVEEQLSADRLWKTAAQVQMDTTDKNVKALDIYGKMFGEQKQSE